MREQEASNNPYENIPPFELTREFQSIIDQIPRGSFNPIDDPSMFSDTRYRSEINTYKVLEQKVRRLLEVAPVTATYRNFLVFQFRQAYKWGNFPQEKDSFSYRVVGEDEEKMGIYSQEHAKYVEFQDFRMAFQMSQMSTNAEDTKKADESKKYFFKWREEFINKYNEDPQVDI